MKELSDLDIQLLEDFWNGQLSETKKQEVENRLNKDAAFRTLADEWQLLFTQARIAPKEEEKEAGQIKDRLLNYAKEEKEIKKIRSIRPIYYLLSAAAAVALILLWLNFNDSLFEKDPASQYFSHLSRDNANLSPGIESGEDAYDQKKYDRAYTLLVEEVAAGSDSLNLIYASVAAIGNKQGAQAILILEPLVNTESWQLYQSEIQWYLALAYMQEGETEKASVLLKIIADANGEYAKNAQALIKQIRVH